MTTTFLLLLVVLLVGGALFVFAKSEAKTIGSHLVLAALIWTVYAICIAHGLAKL